MTKFARLLAELPVRSGDTWTEELSRRAEEALAQIDSSLRIVVIPVSPAELDFWITSRPIHSIQLEQ